ncbi:efflux RND transporter periplasmic adaptor subunit [Hymenobacter sp. AT01-02]|uniref:efflux RND transporter periplasmic adaptor subunit n=1 Tax=Hymenobacter sp. AT01-02 TaxID=1571877 RepID=UPI0009E80631|nr:efflux RND transporter periplasmic adaptor subunit [Hymenobacter sp. AT01-02]
MKKLLGMVLVLLVAVGSCALPCWLAPATPTLSAATLPDSLTPPGPRVVLPGRPVEAAQAGRVWEVYVAPGQRVRKGDMLAKLAQPLHTLEQQRLQGLLAQQQRAHAALLAQQPAASAAAVAAAHQKIQALRLQLAQAPQALTFVFVTAPEDGLITTRPVAPGDYLQAHAAVLTYQPGTAADTTLLLTSVE